MADRLEDIKAEVAHHLIRIESMQWLIAEVEKLRAQKQEGLDIITEQAVIIRHLNAELARCANEHE